MIGVGEIVAGVAISLAHLLGIELKAPAMLKHKQEFPDCAAILNGQTVARLPNGYASRYVNLCRITGLAWAVWIALAASLLFIVGFYMRHGFYSDKEAISVMEEHILARVSSVNVTCLEMWFAFIAGASVMTVYYNILLLTCRDWEAKLNSPLTVSSRTASEEA